MKITDVKLYILEQPDRSRPAHTRLVQVPNLHRIQYTHRGRPWPTAALRQSFVEVHTDEGITGRCDTRTLTPAQVDILRHHVVGEDPFSPRAAVPDAPQGHALGLPEPRLVRRI